MTRTINRDRVRQLGNGIILGVSMLMTLMMPLHATSLSYTVGGEETKSTAFTGSVKFQMVRALVDCNVTLKIDVVHGQAAVTQATVAGPGACAGLTAQALPWKISPPFRVTGLDSMRLVISGALFQAQAPATACTQSMIWVISETVPQTLHLETSLTSHCGIVGGLLSARTPLQVRVL